MSEYVIGLDLGNFNSFPSSIEDLDLTQKRLGGRVVDLLPDSENGGIPSVFFYNAEARPEARMLSGRAACSGAAKPESNRVQYLKRDLGKPLAVNGKPLVIEGRQWLVDDAIREVVQSVVREANGYLQANQGQTTPLISLAYPASYSCAQRQRLIEIVESATLADGRHLKVFGTIAEPAAAALDFLASNGRTGRETTVLAYDMGGGTFDLGLVTCYPQGKRSSGGQTVYYDIHKTVGIPDLGGKEFDEIVYQLLCGDLEKKLRAAGFLQPLSARAKTELHYHAEELKRELTDVERTSYEIYLSQQDEDITVEITREQFEKASQKLVAKTVEATKAMAEDPLLPKPDVIVLTGGASQMPMIKKALEQALPAYRGKIELFRPSRSISHGAARYGCAELIREPSVELPPRPVGDKVVTKRVAFDLGLRYHRVGRKAGEDIIQTVIPAGTELPYTSPWKWGYTIMATTHSKWQVYEARNGSPDRNKPDQDYRHIMETSVEFGREVPEDTPSQSRLILDQNGLLTLQSRRDAGSEVVTAKTTLKDLS